MLVQLIERRDAKVLSFSRVIRAIREQQSCFDSTQSLLTSLFTSNNAFGILCFLSFNSSV